MSVLAEVRGMGWRLLAATLATAVLAIAGLVIGASPASAHNVLKSSSPADGKKVARTPSSVVLTFDEPAIAIGTKLVITGPEGPVQIGKPSLVDNTVTQDLQPGSPAGAYTVDWRVTSADGHPISGSFTFTAEAAASGPSAASSLAPQPSTAATSATTPTAPTARGSSGLWLVAAAILVVASGLIAIGRRRRLTSGDRS
ncbi:MAG TPA: copper resistance CopC family protein [Propionibacteriaceae bacterium]|jgi:copper resistance protein C|nr:copper resistance CopC family protein [Propionibacteriaceae bacterium]